MKVAIVGSRNLEVTDLKKYLPKDIDEIVSGGATKNAGATRYTRREQAPALRGRGNS